ncbi:MAG: rhombosortase [Comamonadaceae bacterium]|nr:MAG: rhombosortase [Comamonadaceae bacterium]
MSWEGRPLFIRSRKRFSLPGEACWALGLGLALLALQLGGEAARSGLRYERGAILDGEAWRLLAAHFVHLGGAHLALNLAGIALCAALSPRLFSRRLLWTVPFLAINISVLMLVFSPGVADYVGFSGVLYGLFICGLWPQRRDSAMAVALLLVAGWMLWQWLGGPMASEERIIGGHIVSIAHVHGGWLGVLLASVTLLDPERQHRRHRRSR